MLDPAQLERILAQARLAPCVESLGLTLLEAQPGWCRLSARHDPRYDGVLPGFHGGMLANVADCAAWFAVVTQIDPAETLLTTDLDVRYLNPCLTDVIAAARVIKLGKTLCPVMVELGDTAGQAVAIAQVTYIRVDSVRAVTNGVSNPRGASDS
ncbi:MAG: PaaI family thioesterase [Phycisphaerae bacterium]